MRTLTEAEISEEVGFIERFQVWPLWPVLPVKHINRGDPDHPEDQQVGVVFASVYQVIPEVILMNLLELQTGPLGPQIEGKQRLKFDSIEAMVRSGWIGE